MILVINSVVGRAALCPIHHKVSGWFIGKDVKISVIGYPLFFVGNKGNFFSLERLNRAGPIMRPAQIHKYTNT